MKNFVKTFPLLCLALLVATSCSEKSKFKEFAVDFAHAVNSSDTVQIDSMLAQPNSYQFSKVKLGKINPDSLDLVEKGEGKYQITSSGDVKMVVAKVGEKMVVENTWKVFGSEPDCVSFALKHNFIKEQDDDKTVYDALNSEQYATAKAAELEEQKFAKEQEEAQKVIGTLLAAFKDAVGSMQEMYNMDPASIWWSVNQPVLTEADSKKRALDKQRKYMTPEQQSAFDKLASQYQRLIK